MKAAVYPGGGAPLSIETRDDPVPEAGEIVIRVHRCGICGTDLHMTSGHGWDFRAGAVPGHEYAGEVVALGRGVEGLRAGDMVAGRLSLGCGRCEACRIGNVALCRDMVSSMGGFAEYHRLAATSAVRLPAGFTAADGALVEPFAIGLHGVKAASPDPGDRVLILGAGTVALTTLFWARRLGAGRIVVASRSERRAEMALAMGADAFVATGEDEVRRVADALGGAPDIVFECAGAPGLLAQAVSHVRVLGRIVSLGFCTAPDAIVPGAVAFKGVRLDFPMGYSGKTFEHAADALLSGHADPKTIVTRTVPLAAVAEAFAMLRAPNADTKVHVLPHADVA